MNLNLSNEDFKHIKYLIDDELSECLYDQEINDCSECNFLKSCKLYRLIRYLKACEWLNEYEN